MLKSYSEISNYYRVNISRYTRVRIHAHRGGVESRCRWVVGWKKRGDGLCVEGDGGGRHGLCTRVETLKTHKYVGGYEQREYVLAGNQKCHVRIAILASLPSPLSDHFASQMRIAICETFLTLPPPPTRLLLQPKLQLYASFPRYLTSNRSIKRCCNIISTEICIRASTRDALPRKIVSIQGQNNPSPPSRIDRA